MSDRVNRKTAVALEMEPSYGSGEVSFSSTSFLLLVNDPEPKHGIDRQTVPRGLVRPWLGASQHLPSWRSAEIEVTVEMAGSGTPGVPPPWGKLLRCCGWAETIYTGGANDRVEYVQISDGQESGRTRYFRDGVRYDNRGVRGTLRQINLTAGARATITAALRGIDTNASANTPGSVDFSAWQTPDVIVDTNSGDVTFGCTLSNGNLSGGTRFPSHGLTIDAGHQVEHIPMLGGERIAITGREATGECQLGLTAAQEVDWRTAVNNAQITSFGFAVSSTGGRMIRIFAPRMQRVDPQAEDYQGYTMVKTGLRFVPETGNDELRIIVR